jgi:hypothetical protein
VFTARYALSPYIKQTRFVFKGLIFRSSGAWRCVTGYVAPHVSKGVCNLIFRLKLSKNSFGLRQLDPEDDGTIIPRNIETAHPATHLHLSDGLYLHQHRCGNVKYSSWLSPECVFCVLDPIVTSALRGRQLHGSKEQKNNLLYNVQVCTIEWTLNCDSYFVCSCDFSLHIF